MEKVKNDCILNYLYQKLKKDSRNVDGKFNYAKEID